MHIFNTWLCENGAGISERIGVIHEANLPIKNTSTQGNHCRTISHNGQASKGLSTNVLHDAHKTRDPPINTASAKLLQVRILVLNTLRILSGFLTQAGMVDHYTSFIAKLPEYIS